MFVLKIQDLSTRNSYHSEIMVSTGARQHQHHIIIRRMKDKILRQRLQMEEIINKKHSSRLLRRKPKRLVSTKREDKYQEITNGQSRQDSRKTTNGENQNVSLDRLVSTTGTMYTISKINSVNDKKTVSCVI